MAQLLDSNYVEKVINRLESIAPDARPNWGTLNPSELTEHLIWAVRASMRLEGEIPFMGNWLTVHVLRPLLAKGILTIPKNIKTPKQMTDSGNTLRSPGDLNDLRRTLNDFVRQAEEGSLECGPHPAFGDIGVQGWRRFHVLHFEHHCKQYGV